jgi:hypothetical protein
MQLIARKPELARLLAFLADCAHGPAWLVVEGEPGIGKTAVFEAALAACSGLRLLRVRCAQAESGAYLGLADLLGPGSMRLCRRCRRRCGTRWTSRCCAPTRGPTS